MTQTNQISYIVNDISLVVKQMKRKKYKNLYQITFLPAVFPINCFVLEQADNLIVIDMGTGQFVKAIQKLCKETGKKVSKLLLTHAHGDHVNGVPQFRKMFPDACIGISKRDKLLLEGRFSVRKGEPDKKVKGGFPKASIPIDFTFEDEDKIDSLTVIASPGHTPGSVSFFESDNKLLIVGDAFQIRGGIAVSGTLKLGFPFPKMATWDAETAIESAQKLAAYSPDLLAVGHGSMLIQPIMEMKRAIEKSEKGRKQ